MPQMGEGHDAIDRSYPRCINPWRKIRFSDLQRELVTFRGGGLMLPRKRG